MKRREGINSVESACERFETKVWSGQKRAMALLIKKGGRRGGRRKRLAARDDWEDEMPGRGRRRFRDEGKGEGEGAGANLREKPKGARPEP